jgi:hypothetical protein
MKEETTYVFKDYLLSEAAYAEAEAYWENFFQEIAREAEEEGAWFTFLNASTHLGSGEVWHPVYQAAELGALSPILRKIRSKPNKLIFLSVMDGRHLTTPSQDKKAGVIEASVGAGYWDTPYTDGEVDELRIWTMPTTDVLPMIRGCILEWMKDGVDRRKMVEYIIRNDFRG